MKRTKKSDSPQQNGSDVALFPVVVIGASAGGVSALSKIMRGLAPDFRGCVLIVLHTSARSVLPEILSRKSSLKAEHAREGQLLEPAQILIAPPDHHLVVIDHRVILSRGPKQNNVRPAIDPLFKSAARIFGRRVIAVVLSGTMDDGSAGLVAVKRHGGKCIVQSPQDAEYPEMPQNALAAVKVDHVLTAEAIGLELNKLVARTSKVSMKKPNSASREVETVEAAQTDSSVTPRGKITTLTCPECGGTLWERHEGNLLRFVCHTGHEFSADSLGEAQNNGVENALWIALRTLKERAMFLRRLIDAAGESKRRYSWEIYRREEAELEQRAKLIQKVLLKTHSGKRLARQFKDRSKPGGRLSGGGRKRSPASRS